MDRLLNFRPEPFPELDHSEVVTESEFGPLADEWDARNWDAGEIEQENAKRSRRRPPSRQTTRTPRKAPRRAPSLAKPFRSVRLPPLQPSRLPGGMWKIASSTVVGIPFVPALADANRPEKRSNDSARSEGSGTPPAQDARTETGSERVRWVQDCLNRALGLELAVDGIMSPQTRGALRLFQRQHGLPVTGLVGPDTEAALTAAVRPPRTRGSRTIDVQRAASLNRKSSIELGWIDYASAIRDLLGLSTRAPSEARFARAVAAWQARQRGLRTDGVVDRATLAAMRQERLAGNFTGLNPRHALDATPANTLLTQLREVAFQKSAAEKDDIEHFVTVKAGITPEGHELLTRHAAQSLGLSQAEQNALQDGVRAPDEVPLWTQLTDPTQPRRHANRRNYIQRQSQALQDMRSQLASLYARLFSQPDRVTAFRLIGEALHLIQDSYCPAHVEREPTSDRMGRTVINYIRYYGPGFSSPIEHGFPMDARDFVGAFGKLFFWSRLAINVSREFLVMARNHLAAGVPKSKDLRRFLDQHYVLNPTRPWLA